MNERYNELEVFRSFLRNAHEMSINGNPYIIVENSNFKNIVTGLYSEIAGKALWHGAIGSLSRTGMDRLRGRSRNTPINIFLVEITTLNRIHETEHMLLYENVNVLINATNDNFETEVEKNVRSGLNPFTRSLLKHMEFID